MQKLSQEIQVRANSKTSERMKKLWDFDDFDDIYDDNNYEGEQQQQQRRDDDDNEKYNPTSHGSEEESESSYDRQEHKLWTNTNTRIHCESRKDITKQTLNDLTEMELFTKEMRKRIMQYGSNRVVGDDDERNKEGGQQKRGGNIDGEEEKDEGEEETGIEIVSCIYQLHNQVIVKKNLRMMDMANKLYHHT